MKQIPLVAFDVGGIYEMLDFDANAEAVVLEPTLEGLTAKLTGVYLRCSQAFSAHFCAHRPVV